MSVEPLSGGLVDNGTEFIAKELQLWPPHQDPRCHRALPPALQSRAAAQLAQLAFSATLDRGKIPSNPRRSHHITQARD